MKICFGCFGSYDDQFEICPHCGYAEGTEPELGIYMRPGTILQERYVIGRALGHGGFSVTYLAWDALLQHKIAVKEYLPSEYATRQPGESRLTVFSGKPANISASASRNFSTRPGVCPRSRMRTASSISTTAFPRTKRRISLWSILRAKR